jgi:hypothetical protein
MPTWQVVAEFNADDQVRTAVAHGALGPFRLPRWKETTAGQSLVVTESITTEESKELFARSWQTVERLRRKLRTRDQPISVTMYPQNRQEPAPEIVGLSEAAKMLGVTRQRALQLSKTRTFPTPIVRLAAGPVYLRRDIDNFGAQRDQRRQTLVRKGRPAAHAHRIPEQRREGHQQGL